MPTKITVTLADGTETVFTQTAVAKPVDVTITVTAGDMPTATVKNVTAE